MVASIPLVLCWIVMPFGDRVPPPEVVVSNNTAWSLYLRFDSGRGFADGEGDLPVDFGRGYRPREWDPPQVGRRYRIRVYLNGSSERPLCGRDLTPWVVRWDRDIRLAVEPVGGGCQIVVDGVPVTSR